MGATSPEEICQLFQHYMREGDLESVLALYDPEVVFLNEAVVEARGLAELKEELAPLVAMKPDFEYDIKQVIQSRDVALMHTHWTVTAPKAMFSYAIEIARRQPDGTWRWLIGDPFTVGRNSARE